MGVLFVALPIALLLAAAAVLAFILSVKSGQFDDLETPPRRMLYDDVAPRRAGLPPGRLDADADPAVDDSGADPAATDA